MTTHRDSGGIVFQCDGCEDTYETHDKVFETAWLDAKGDGWIARKLDGEWVHYCPDCKGDLK